MARISVTLVTLFTLAACAASKVGEKGAEAFYASAQTVLLTSARPAAEVFRCFESRARLLPTSHVRFAPDLGGYLYRLQAYDLWLEEAIFIDKPTGGSEARFRFAANYDQGWREMLERDRLAPLRGCAAL